MTFLYLVSDCTYYFVTYWQDFFLGEVHEYESLAILIDTWIMFLI